MSRALEKRGLHFSQGLCWKSTLCDVKNGQLFVAPWWDSGSQYRDLRSNHGRLLQGSPGWEKDLKTGIIMQIDWQLIVKRLWLSRGMKRFADGRRSNEPSRTDKRWRGRGGRWTRSRPERGRRERRRKLGKSKRRGECDTRRRSNDFSKKKRKKKRQWRWLPPLFLNYFIFVLRHWRIQQKRTEEEEREREQQRRQVISNIHHTSLKFIDFWYLIISHTHIMLLERLNW